MLAITNGMTYDASQFWNGASAILAGIAFGAIAMLIIPPLVAGDPHPEAARVDAYRSPAARQTSLAWKAGRLGEATASPACWRCPTRPSRSSAPNSLPSVAVGKEIVRLRHVAPRFVPGAMVDAALAALAEGRSGEAIERLDDIDRRVAALPRARSRHPFEPQGQHPGDFGPALPIRLLFRPAAPMRFNEINLFGLYVAPIAVILGVAWIVYLLLRRAGDRYRPDRAGLASRRCLSSRSML